jgi:hypothetical protein
MIGSTPQSANPISRGASRMKLRNVWPPLIIAFFLAFVCEGVAPWADNRVYYLTKPITCPSGTMEVNTYQIHSAEWEIIARCANENGRPAVTMQAGLTLCGMFFLVWFPFVWLLFGLVHWWSRKRAVASKQRSGLKESAITLNEQTYDVEDGETRESSRSQVERMRELKKMVDEGLITVEEYEVKKRAILSEV